MNKARAFLKRDLGIEVSYRLNFLLSLLSVFLAAAVFHFLGKVVDPAALGGAGYDYFSFAIVGIAFSSFLRTGLFSFSNALREEQMMGTLEAMLATPVRGAEVVVYSSLWRFLFASLTAASYLAVGALFFGLSLGRADWPAALLMLALTLVSYCSLGILSACFILVFKRGDPVNWLVGNLSTLLAGVYYPLEVMPGWLQGLARVIPLTWSIRGLRLALLEGYGIGRLGKEILALGAISAVLLPLSLALFGLSLRHAKRTGSLLKY
jgi:ABC-2 type transport system permease protein